MNKIILVTGVAGFIGSNLAEELLNFDYSIIGIDNFDDYYSPEIKENNISELTKNPNFILYRADICNKNELDNIFNQNKISAVVHLAAKAGVRPSFKNPDLYIKNNLNGTQNILDTMKRYRVKKLVFASSSSVYGNSDSDIFKEDDTNIKPISPYAQTKLDCEKLIREYTNDINSVILRFFTVYGKRQRPDLAISKFVRHIMSEQSIDVYGDGTTYRDYTYIDDIVSGLLSALNYNKTNYEIINLGCGHPVTLNKMIEIIENVLNKKAIRNFLPMQKGDVLRTYADITKAKQLLNFEPKISFSEGVKRYIQSI